MSTRSHSKDIGEAFLFYFERWRGSRSVQRMSFSERGVYLEMLIEQWLRGGLPDDAKSIADALATSPAQIDEVMSAFPIVRRKFVITDEKNRKNTIQNLSLERVRRDRKKWIKQRKLAAASRWEKSRSDAAALRPQSDRNANRRELEGKGIRGEVEGKGGEENVLTGRSSDPTVDRTQKHPRRAAASGRALRRAVSARVVVTPEQEALLKKHGLG